MTPNLQLPTPPWEAAASLLEQYKKAVKQRYEAGAEVAALDRQAHAVKHEDLENHASALLAGKPKPPSALEKHEAKIASKRAELAPLELNRDRLAEEFLQHIQANKQAYRQAITDQLAELGNQPVNLDNLERIEQALQWREWLDRFPVKCHVLRPLRLKVGVQGQEVSLREVLEAASGVVHAATQPDEAEESEREAVDA